MIIKATQNKTFFFLERCWWPWLSLPSRRQTSRVNMPNILLFFPSWAVSKCLNSNFDLWEATLMDWKEGDAFVPLLLCDQVSVGRYVLKKWEDTPTPKKIENDKAFTCMYPLRVKCDHKTKANTLLFLPFFFFFIPIILEFIFHHTHTNDYRIDPSYQPAFFTVPCLSVFYI